MAQPAEPSSHILDAHKLAAATLPFADTADFADADRGFIAALSPGAVSDADGAVVWDGDTYDFLGGDCPPSVHPSLWRQSGLVAKQGLYAVTDGVYQVRGLDLSNITMIEGDRGVIVVDPLVSRETAAAALALYREHRGPRPVTGMVYTHAHVDHFGGVQGVITAQDAESGHCPVLAPAGFIEHAVAENIYAGTAMARRAGYMYGAALPRGPRGSVGAGLGPTTSVGTTTIIAPTLEITHTGQEEVIDGVRLVFQLTPGTECPAEMNFYLPQRRALCMAENATHTMHNLGTLRGALVRDPHVWSAYLTESIGLYAGASDVVFSPHHWPTWGTERITEFLSLQRDLYGYLHDQTLRLINQGHTGVEIAETLQLPPALADAWHTRGYYGSLSHNVKAIYQRYMGWFDGNPAHLWEHPPVASALRHVEFMGGAAEVLRKARLAFAEGDYRWAAQVVNYCVFADPDNEEAKLLQADALEQLGYGAENGTWRNFYLTGAHELRHGSLGTPTRAGSPSMLGALTVEQAFDVLSLRVDAPRAWDEHLVIDWRLTDQDRVRRTELRNGVLIHHNVVDSAAIPPAQLTITLTRPSLIGVLIGGRPFQDEVGSGAISIEGDITALGRLVGVLDKPDPDFAIVTP
ncbi:alkyl/aryl-sulfatase [Tomitella biformata]|uniref:alkyl/aryl-sulfatase n=1 Tax=Tomitella biformata TaxID=630403 RepID=UPI00046339FB|nr:alkyl sulfatase dimerization domain-containing protein [Tomitella biformata]